jgi:23S rRNA (uracil1939-C5)-methyltransferase
MAMGEIFTAPVEHIAAGGAGILTYKGQSIFMDFTAPGDMATGRIIEEKKGWARAELVELAEASLQRVSPPCPLYRQCGGCSLQHLSYTAQVREKSLIVQEALRRIGGFSLIPELKILPSPPYEYRNRMQFHRISRPRAARVGLKAGKSGEIIPIQDCPIADPGIRGVLRAGKLIPPPDKDRFTVYARGKTLLSEGLDGAPSRGRVPVLGRDIRMDAGVFFQSNGTGLEALAADLLTLGDRVDPALPMADIYCGVGTFGAFLGDRFPRIDMVEENRQALALARENVRGREVRFFAQREDQWVKNRDLGVYGFMVADPPRHGLGPALRSGLSRGGPDILAYVSCDPATLARDSRELCAGGYRLEQLGLYDFYPQTAHIETLAVFKRTPSIHGAS